MNSLNKYLLSTYYMPDTVPCAGDTVVNKTVKSPCPPGIYILVGEKDNNNTLYSTVDGEKCYEEKQSRIQQQTVL